MKKILPILLSLFLLFFFTKTSYAQVTPTSVPTATPTQPVTVTPTPVGGGQTVGVLTPVPGNWYPDEEVTFVGKTAARSGNFLNWALENYNWASVSAGSSNALESFWVTIRNIIYGLLILFIFAAALIIMVTRGRNITVWRFAARFGIVVILVTFSF